MTLPKLKMAIFSCNEFNYSNQRLLEEAKKRGHEIQVVNFLRCDAVICENSPSLRYLGESLENIDVVIPRIGQSAIFFGLAMVRQMEMMKKFCLNGSLGIARSKDKLRSLQILARKGLSLPITAFSQSTQDALGPISAVGGAPVIIKLVEGTQGIGVVPAETTKAAESVIEAFHGLKANLIVQEYIKEAKGKDIRCLVLGDEVIASMQRTAKEGEFRSNIHRGATSEIIEITSEEKKVAIKAVKELRLDVAGVDIIRSKRGPLILEVNSSPGLEGIETTTKINIAGKIVEYIENHFIKKIQKNRSQEI